MGPNLLQKAHKTAQIWDISVFPYIGAIIKENDSSIEDFGHIIAFWF
jgi:hypothetical protein